MSRPTRRPQAGFTLMEVLIAVAVLAIALGALTKSASDNARNAAYLEEKTLAHWVGINKATELRLANAWPDPGRANGSEELGNRQWLWQMEISVTPEPDLRRIDIAVAPRETPDAVADRITVFLRKPIELRDLVGGR